MMLDPWGARMPPCALCEGCGAATKRNTDGKISHDNSGDSQDCMDCTKCVSLCMSFHPAGWKKWSQDPRVDHGTWLSRFLQMNARHHDVLNDYGEVFLRTGFGISICAQHLVGDP